MKKKLAVIMAGLMVIASLAGCSGQSSTSSTTAASTTSTTAAEAATTKAAEAETTAAEAKAPAEKEHLEFWSLITSDGAQAAFQEVIAEFNASQDICEVEFVPVNSNDFDTKLSLAIEAGTAPAILTLNTNMLPYVVRGLVRPIGDDFYSWDVSSEISESAMQLTADLGGGTIYGIPFVYNQDVNWFNTAFGREHNVEAPVTQKEFIALCEEYADPANNTYFFSLRGDKPGDNLFNWLFTYADLGYSWFDEDGNCIVNRPEFVEGLDAYVGLYKNGWVSSDCVTNDFNAMVAEFGSGTAQYVMHNNGSAATHKANLGEGNYACEKPLTSDSGRYYCSAVGQSQKYCLFNRGDDVDYTGGLMFIEYMIQAENVAKVALGDGKMPINVKCFEMPEFSDDSVYDICQSMSTDPNYIPIQTPYWLADFATYRNGDLTPDFQAVMMGDMSSQEFLDNLAELVETAQASYNPN